MAAQKSAVSDGFSAGLKLFLVLLIALVIAGYSVFLSIFMGLLGAFAWGLIVAWDNVKVESSPPPKPAEPESKDEAPEDSAKPNRWQRASRYPTLTSRPPFKRRVARRSVFSRRS